MEEQNAIEVKNLHKSFKVYLDRSYSLKDFLLRGSGRRKEVRHVLQGINFSVKKGEAIGLVGHNGCGKSTTLKLLTRIMYPDQGTIELKGRVSSLIELGAGFHPDMSGRENIYINASIFGLKKKEIDERLQKIIDFSELQEYIDNPVRTYSSGMYMRLAFAVAINVDADILLIDEILAVGDVAFQAKCFTKLNEIKQQGTTIVIVSHSLDQIERICDKCYWIQDGKIRAEGNPREVHSQYLEFMAKSNIRSESDMDRKIDRHSGNQEAVVKAVRMINEKGELTDTFTPGENVRIEIDCSASRKIEDAVFGFGIFSLDNQEIYGTNTLIDKMPLVIEGDVTVTCQITCLPLKQGSYKLDVEIHTPFGFDYDYWRDYMRFYVRSTSTEAGVLHMERKWNHFPTKLDGEKEEV